MADPGGPGGTATGGTDADVDFGDDAQAAADAMMNGIMDAMARGDDPTADVQAALDTLSKGVDNITDAEMDNIQGLLNSISSGTYGGGYGAGGVGPAGETRGRGDLLPTKGKGQGSTNWAMNTKVGENQTIRSVVNRWGKLIESGEMSANDFSSVIRAALQGITGGKGKSAMRDHAKDLAKGKISLSQFTSYLSKILFTGKKSGKVADRFNTDTVLDPIAIADETDETDTDTTDTDTTDTDTTDTDTTDTDTTDTDTGDEVDIGDEPTGAADAALDQINEETFSDAEIAKITELRDKLAAGEMTEEEFSDAVLTLWGQPPAPPITDDIDTIPDPDETPWGDTGGDDDPDTDDTLLSGTDSTEYGPTDADTPPMPTDDELFPWGPGGGPDLGDGSPPLDEDTKGPEDFDDDVVDGDTGDDEGPDTDTLLPGLTDTDIWKKSLLGRKANRFWSR